MAKVKRKAKAKTSVVEIPEHMRPYMEYLPERDEVRLKGIVVPRLLVTPILDREFPGQASVTTDVTKCGGQSQMIHPWLYGWDKIERDGAPQKRRVNGAEVTLEGEEKLRWHVAHAEQRRAVFYGEEVLQTKARQGDRVGAELKRMLTEWLHRNRRDSDGKKFTGKTSPQSLARAATTAEVLLAAAELEIGENILKSKLASAEDYVKACQMDDPDVSDIIDV